MSKDISLIIPTYNERDNIQPLVEQIDRVLSSRDYEVVFIDDDSKDGTAELIKELSHKYPIRVVVRTDKKGLASAVVDGIGYAAGGIIGVMDADLQHPPEVVPLLVAAIREDAADLAIGSRYVAGGSVEGWPWKRRMTSAVACRLARAVTPIRDATSGFFFFRKTVIEGVRLDPRGFKIGLEIFVRGKYRSWREVPYTFTDRRLGASKLGAGVMLRYAQQLLRLLGWKANAGRTPQG